MELKQFIKLPPNPAEEKGQFRRQYPRRSFKSKVGVLCSGIYFIAEAGEIGEGGMSFVADYVLSIGDELVLSFQIPKADFMFVRATVRSLQKSPKGLMYGLSFKDVEFVVKRQIRSFVSDRKIK